MPIMRVVLEGFGFSLAAVATLVVVLGAPLCCVAGFDCSVAEKPVDAPACPHCNKEDEPEPEPEPMPRCEYDQTSVDLSVAAKPALLEDAPATLAAPAVAEIAPALLPAPAPERRATPPPASGALTLPLLL